MTNFKKIMKEKGSEMVMAAAKEIKASRSEPNASQNTKVIQYEKANEILKEIKKNGKVTTSVPIAKIVIDENVRKQFSKQNIKELGESLKEVGLLHNIILHIVKRDGNFYFHCVSGMRRVLAAESISWVKIEADITLEQDPIESLYIGAIANLHEAVFWLDNALLYSKLFSHGHTDEQIAQRVKANPRTVGWFRRLAHMSPACQSLAYLHPNLFNSRWAQQVARHGELPESTILEKHMKEMIVQNRTWHSVHSELKEKSNASTIDKSEAVVTAHRIVTDFKPEHLNQTQLFLTSLVQSGFLAPSSLKKIQTEFFKKANENSHPLQGIGSITETTKILKENNKSEGSFYNSIKKSLFKKV